MLSLQELRILDDILWPLSWMYDNGMSEEHTSKKQIHKNSNGKPIESSYNSWFDSDGFLLSENGTLFWRDQN